MSQQHIIGKQIVEVLAGSRERGMQAQDEVSELCTELLLPGMEELFSSLTGPDTLLRLDKLEINISDVSSSSFKADFTRKALAAIEEEILKKKYELSVYGNTDTDTIQIRNEMLQGNPDERTQLRLSGMESLSRFVKTGTVPWYVRSGEIPSMKTEFLRILEEDPVAARFLLEDMLTDRASIRRFIYQFGEDKVYAAVGILGLDSNKLSILNNELGALLNHACPGLNAKKLQTLLLEKTIRLSVQYSGGGSESLYRKYFFTVLIELIRNVDMRFREGEIELIRNIDMLFREEDKQRVFATLAELMADPAKAGVNISSSSLLIAGEVLKALSSEEAFAGIKAQTITPAGKENDTIAPARTTAEPQEIPLKKNLSPEDMLQEAQAKKATMPEDLIIQWKADAGASGSVPLYSTEETFYTSSAGLVIVWPFLGMFFKELGLMEAERFRDEQSAVRGAVLLHYLATGEEQVPEEALVLHKLLCGLPLNTALPEDPGLTEKEKMECEDLLKSVIRYWTIVQNINPDGLRQTFIQREGAIALKPSGWTVTVQRNTLDVLMDKLPWGISIIMLPWNDYMIHVEW